MMSSSSDDDEALILILYLHLRNRRRKGRQNRSIVEDAEPEDDHLLESEETIDIKEEFSEQLEDYEMPDTTDCKSELINSNSDDSRWSVNDAKDTAAASSTSQPTKKIKLGTESQTAGSIPTPTTESQFLGLVVPLPAKQKEETNETETDGQTEKVISAWMELVGSRLREFDDYTREFLMNQIDNYLFRAKVKQIKRMKEEKKKRATVSAAQYPHPVYSVQPVQPLYVDIPSTSGLTSNQNCSQENASLNHSSSESTTSIIEVKEERIDDEEI